MYIIDMIILGSRDIVTHKLKFPVCIVRQTNKLYINTTKYTEFSKS